MARMSIVMMLCVSGLFACTDSETPEIPLSPIFTCTTTRALTSEGHAGAQLPAKTLALTFDDGPSEITAELSQYLQDEGVPATFFVNGVHVEGREDALDAIA